MLKVRLHRDREALAAMARRCSHQRYFTKFLINAGDTYVGDQPMRAIFQGEGRCNIQVLATKKAMPGLAEGLGSIGER
ncbi:MAG: hypothetical protein JW999_01195 [Methanotrichaceae archaeon]|nr:hypothetical protein [Methanotrichaceae archaeon]